MSLVFFSGSPGGIDDGMFQRLYSKVEGRLLSMRYARESERWLERADDDDFGFDTSGMELMLDSGAYTAWTKREPSIDVYWLRDQYHRFDRTCGKRFKSVWFVNLDVIPGRPKKWPTDREIEDAVYRSDRNHAVLRDALGDRVLPVFHQYEGEGRLEEVLKINPVYIGVSPQNWVVEEDRRAWALNVHAKLDGVVMTHGLATTGGEMMETIDWRSVDSARWVMQAAHGSVLLVWNDQLTTLPIGRRVPPRRKLDERMLKKVDEICDELKIKPNDLRDPEIYDHRYLFNVDQTIKWSKRLHARGALA
jgi:hypothetical protein